MATVGMFDWRLFDNSNRTKVVRRPKKLGCSTQIMFDGKLTIVEHKINRLNQKYDYVQLILISTLKMDNCRT